MKKMAGVSWGCHSKILLLVFTVLYSKMLHRLLYISLIDTSRPSNLEKFDKIQRKALRIVTGFMNHQLKQGIFK